MSAEPIVLPCTQVIVENPRRTNRLAWLGLLFVLVGTPIGGIYFGWIGLLAMLGASIFALVRSAQSAATKYLRAELRLDVDALSIIRQRARSTVDLTIPLDAIESGYETMNERTVVVLTKRGERIRIVLDQQGEPARVLAHARVDVAQRVLKLPLRRTVGAFTIGFMTYWPFFVFILLVMEEFVRHRGALFLSSLGLAGVLTALVVRWLGFPHVVIGSDGVRILGTVRRRFLPYESLERVELIAPSYGHAPPSILLHLRGGKKLRLPMVAAPRERVEGLVRRIQKAARAHADGGGSRREALARSGRPLSAWKADIERLALAPPGFRDSATGREDFERVLADGAATPDQRVGAALALRILDPNAAAPLIRVAAEASADETLREALSAAAEGEVEAALLERATRR